MKKRSAILSLLLIVSATMAFSQSNSTYTDSIKKFQQKYVKDHDVVKGKDKDHMHFFPVNAKYRITARFERIDEAPWFNMETSGKAKQVYRVYGILHFKINDTTVKLHVYQSRDLMRHKEYATSLFAPFTDLTCGEESYENGRYIDMTIDEVEGGQYVIDFNKAYNPYCAYVSDQYNCPIPPKENDLPVAVKAGEMKYSKH